SYILLQKRASEGDWLKASQNLVPSLHDPQGIVLAPVENVPIGISPAASQRETELVVGFVTRILSPSNAADSGMARPLPVSVARPPRAGPSTPERDALRPWAPRMSAPWRRGIWGPPPTVPVCRTAPAASNFRSFPPLASVAHTFEPSKRTPVVPLTVTVVTVQGSEVPGVTIETEPPLLADQTRPPSNVKKAGPLPRLVATVSAKPAGKVGSIR